VPAGPAAPEPGGELEGAEDGVPDSADDVHDHGHGGGGGARVGEEDVRTTSQLDQTQRPGYGGDQDEGDQRDWNPPARPGRPGGAGWRVAAHLAPAGSSCGLAGLGVGRAVGVRWSRHSE
jgi:hypothetical protein